METNHGVVRRPYFRLFVTLLLPIGLSLLIGGLVWAALSQAERTSAPDTPAPAALRPTLSTGPQAMRLDIPPDAYAGGGDDGPDLALRQSVQQRIAEFRAQGLLAMQRTSPLTHTWPLRQAAGLNDFGFYAITQLTDNDLAPDSLLDYACGARTYDFSYYNHGGTDIVPWPFPWNQMQGDQVEVIASAPGIIVQKYADDTDDQNCFLTPPVSFGNYIAIVHADGYVTWYGHMKYGSLTAKQPGDAVETGEYLGVVGSSGFASGPHLHFEVTDGDQPLAPKLDPFAGPCNLLNPNTGSLWQDQPPYFNSGVNKLTVGSHPPYFKACPTPDIPNEDNIVPAGQTVYFSAYQREMPAGLTTTYRLWQPNGALYSEWVWPSDNMSGTTPTDEYLSARVFPMYLPNQAPVGPWKYEAELQGQLYQRTFGVSSPLGNHTLYLSADRSGTIGSVSFEPGDILKHNLNTDSWGMYFDGSDVGINDNVDAFTLVRNNLLFLSFEQRVQLPGLRKPVDPADVVLFRASSTGDNTAGRFTLFFDGSDVGLEETTENIDALALDASGQVLMSLAGDFSVPANLTGTVTLTGLGQDIIRFRASRWYGNTQGYWELYQAGEAIGLRSPSENIDGMWINPTDPELFLSTSGAYSVPGYVGDDDDILVCALNNGQCNYGLFFDWEDFGVDGFYYTESANGQ